MTIAKRLSECGASEEAMIQLETQIGARLPDDYRRFMAEYNGGRPEPSSFNFAFADGQSESAVRYFLTLDEREERYTIQEFMDRYSDRIPQGTLPIASDSFGNLVLLNVDAKSPGAVCFWDHELESMNEPTWENIAAIAPTFTDFLNLLR